MHFISFEFVVFFAVVFTLYAVSPYRRQNFILLVASYVFYGWWDWRFLSLLFATSCIDFVAGQFIGKINREGGREAVRRYFLYASIGGNIGVLAFFKYFNFFIDSATIGLRELGFDAHPETLSIILPIGISFYTFQTLTYTIDIYRRQLEPTRDFFAFCLYVSFFPQLVAGPIERARRLLPQILRKREISAAGVESGLCLMAWGYFKKVVIADNAALIANYYYGSSSATGFEFYVATLAFSFQIYGDFSGYTDIARGAARIMGFDICPNFNLPYFAHNPREFWRRWHMSLSQWFRDYVYIPLGGNRCGRLRNGWNMFVTMALCGLWHGAAWKFILWGVYHGGLLTVYAAVSETALWRRIAERTILRKTGHVLAVLISFQFTLFGWMLFRAADMAQISVITNSLFSNFTPTVGGAWLLLRLAVLALPLILMQAVQAYTRNMEPWMMLPRSDHSGRSYFATARRTAVVALLISVLILDPPVVSAFIYFQF